MNGVAHGAQPPPSRSHSNVEPASVDARPNVGVAFELGLAGVERNDVSGAVRSTVHANVSGVASMLPAASTARTANVWADSARPVYDAGLVHEPNAAPSSEHSKEGPASEAVNEKLAEVEVVAAAGVDVIVVFAGVVSTVNRNEAGVGSTLPAASVARTSKV